MKSKVAICSNVWTRLIHLEKGESYGGHKHHFDHVHLLSVGTIKITIDGCDTIYEAPTQIIIKKELNHDIECLSEESIGTCIHAIRKGGRIEDIFDPDMCPSYVEGTEAERLYPSSELVSELLRG